MFFTATSSTVHFQNCGENEEASSWAGNGRNQDCHLPVETYVSLGRHIKNNTATSLVFLHFLIFFVSYEALRIVKYFFFLGLYRKLPCSWPFPVFLWHCITSRERYVTQSHTKDLICDSLSYNLSGTWRASRGNRKNKRNWFGEGWIIDLVSSLF